MRNRSLTMSAVGVQKTIINKEERFILLNTDLSIGDDVAIHSLFQNGELSEDYHLIRIKNITPLDFQNSNPNHIQNSSLIDFEWIPTSYDYFVNLSQKEKRTLKSLFIHLDEFSRNEDNDPVLVFDLIRGVLNVNSLYDIDIDWYFRYFDIQPRYFKHRI